MDTTGPSPHPTQGVAVNTLRPLTPAECRALADTLLVQGGHVRIDCDSYTLTLGKGKDKLILGVAIPTDPAAQGAERGADRKGASGSLRARIAQVGSQLRRLRNELQAQRAGRKGKEPIPPGCRKSDLATLDAAIQLLGEYL